MIRGGPKLWRESDKEHFVPAGTGKMGMIVFLVSVGMLFGATVVGYIVVRYSTDNWSITPEGPGLPVILWFNTALLIASSVPLYRALVSVRRDDASGLRHGLLYATLLGTLFLIGQVVAWVQMLSGIDAAQLKTQSVFTFCMLTVTHALHVVGGLVALVMVTRRAFKGRYGSFFHPGVVYVNMYWHFLTGVWLVLFAVLLVFSGGGSAAA